jgi:hypothetical protein
MDLVPNDVIEVQGLSLLLAEEEFPPHLALQLTVAGKRFSATILAIELEWGMTVHDEDGNSLVEDADLYPTQSSAILAALLTVIDSAESRSESPPLFD